jgi:hypothetical protein
LTNVNWKTINTIRAFKVQFFGDLSHVKEQLANNTKMNYKTFQ